MLEERRAAGPATTATHWLTISILVALTLVHRSLSALYYFVNSLY
jgi:hypothetical protein